MMDASGVPKSWEMAERGPSAASSVCERTRAFSTSLAQRVFHRERRQAVMEPIRRRNPMN